MTDDNLLLENNVDSVSSNSINLNQQSKSITNDVISSDIESNLSKLIDLRTQSINNPMTGYLNLHSLRNKIDYLIEKQ